MIKTVALAIAVVMTTTASAVALTVTNRDSTEHLVTVDKGPQEAVLKVAPGATVMEPCPDVCGVRIANGTGSDFLAKDDAKLAIKDRKVLPDK
jgi:predicted ribosome-associated RNA-binding protein Tma20